MNILGLIPARAGSRGVPRKNVRDIAGRPLIAWTIEAARPWLQISSVVVSTDDLEIAEVSRAAGAAVPFLRPAKLATDEATSLSVVEHAVRELDQTIDAIVLLQPTSPLRTGDDIKAVLACAGSTGAPSVVSITRSDRHPQWMYQLTKDAKLMPLMLGKKGSRRQDLPPVYVPNGAVYFSQIDWLFATGDFIGPQTIGYEMPAERSIDIDTPLDWHLAELLLRDRMNRATA